MRDPLTNKIVGNVIIKNKIFKKYILKELKKNPFLYDNDININFNLDDLI